MKYFFICVFFIVVLFVLVFDLVLFIDCVFGEICYIQQFVDYDLILGVFDFCCGVQIYDMYKGIDFVLFMVVDLGNDVLVLVVVDGVVFVLCNDIVDVIQGSNDQVLDVMGCECGNGLVLCYLDGWEI